jgi:uncharacterized membrane protein HdeD (DUF308 family)
MKYLNYVMIIIGVIVAFYANNSKEQNVYILILGIILLMAGIYRVSSTIPSKGGKEELDNTENKDEF